MYNSKEIKEGIFKKYANSKKDTGSPEVQVALFTKRIKLLTEHCKKFRKDNHSRRGLVQLVNKRRALLNYLKNNSFAAYTQVIQKLGLRK